MTSDNPLDVVSLVKQIKDMIASVEVTSDNSHFLISAMMRTNELAMLLALAQGKQWPFRKEVSPLTSEINDYFVAIEKRLNMPLPDGLTEEQIEHEIMLRDSATGHLDGARIVAACLLNHLSVAINMSKPETPNLKAV